MGLVQLGSSYIGGRKRLAARDEAQAAYDKSLEAYLSQDTSNLYANMQNTAEDLTVNTREADFIAAEQAQNLSNILGQTRQAAGGSGIAALAQSLANVQSRNAAQAAASIGQQEAANQRMAAQQAAQIQMAERRGAETSRALETQLLGTKFQIDAGQLATAEAAIQQAQAQRAQAFGQLAAGGGGLAMGAAKAGIFGEQWADIAQQMTPQGGGVGGGTTININSGLGG